MAATDRRWDTFTLGLDFQSISWRGFEQELVEERLALMSKLGLRVLRLPLTWPDFQTGPRRLSDRRLRDLEAAMNAAAAYRVGLVPVLFPPGDDGILLPSWASSERDAILQGQLHLLEVLVAYFRGHRAVLAWEIYAGSASMPGMEEDWLRTVVPAARQAAPRHALGLGLTGADLLKGHRALLGGLAPALDIVVLGWSGPYRLASLAAGLALRLTGRRALVRLQQLPSHVAELPNALAELREGGALGALLPLSEDQSRESDELLQIMQEIMAQGWKVEARPPAVPLEPESFFEDPPASWQKLARDQDAR